jgi:RNA polymerase sigma-70 factor, ECF subfamily
VSADGGGLVPASLHPIEGSQRIAEYLVDLAQRAGTVSLLERTVNGQAGLVAVEGVEPVTVFAFEIVGDQIQQIWAVRNPDKLRAWSRT